MISFTAIFPSFRLNPLHKSNPLKTISSIIVTILLLAFSLPANAADKHHDQIEKQFSLQLPGFWRLEKIDFGEAVNYGSENEPIIKQRFSANLVLNEDLYMAKEKSTDVTWLERSLTNGSKLAVNGVATVTGKENAKIDIALEQETITASGTPLSSFPGKSIMKGTPEEEKYYQERNEKNLSDLLTDAQSVLIQKFPAHVRLVKMAFVDADKVTPKNRLLSKPLSLNFQAELEHLEETFIQAGELGNAVILAETADKGEKRNVYGKYSPDESGVGKIEIDGKLQLQNGDVRSAFHGVAFIDGSPELDAYKVKLDEQAKKELEREKEMAAVKAAAAKEKIEMEAKTAAMNRQADQKLAEEKAAAEKVRLDLGAQTLALQVRNDEMKAFAEQRSKQMEVWQQEITKREEAIRAQKDQQQETLRKKAEEGAKIQEITVLQKTLDGQDENAKAIVIANAINTDDEQKQAIALNHILAKSKYISGMITGTGYRSNEVKIPFEIKVDNIDKVGRFKGTLVAHNLSGPVVGSINGPSIKFNSSELKCSQVENDRFKTNTRTIFCNFKTKSIDEINGECTNTFDNDSCFGGDRFNGSSSVLYIK